MNRLVDTSRGWVLLDLGYQDLPRLKQMTATVTAFGEPGWARAEELWAESLSDETLAALVCRVTGIPGEEATRLVDEAVRDWNERGGRGDTAGQRSTLFVAASVFALAVVGVVALIVVAYLVLA